MVIVDASVRLALYRRGLTAQQEVAVCLPAECSHPMSRAADAADIYGEHSLSRPDAPRPTTWLHAAPERVNVDAAGKPFGAASCLALAL